MIGAIETDADVTFTGAKRNINRYKKGEYFPKPPKILLYQQPYENFFTQTGVPYIHPDIFPEGVYEGGYNNKKGEITNANVILKNIDRFRNVIGNLMYVNQTTVDLDNNLYRTIREQNSHILNQTPTTFAGKNQPYGVSPSFFV